MQIHPRNNTNLMMLEVNNRVLVSTNNNKANENADCSQDYDKSDNGSEAVLELTTDSDDEDDEISLASTMAEHATGTLCRSNIT